MPLVRVVNGRPVDPSVRTLMEKFGSVSRGQTIEHADIEKAVGENSKSPRYRTVTNAWRKRIHDTTGVFVEAVPGVGFRGCDASGQLANGGKAVKSAARKLATGVALAQTTPEKDLAPHEKNKREHMLTQGASLAQALKSASGFVLSPPPKIG